MTGPEPGPELLFSYLINYYDRESGEIPTPLRYSTVHSYNTICILLIIESVGNAMGGGE